MSMGSSSRSVIELYAFYPRDSWSNFLLSYVNVIWLIPAYLHQKRMAAYIGMTSITLAAYVIIRYSNHVLQSPDMYTYFTRSGSELVILSLKVGEIARSEVLKGLQFTLLSMAYRFILDRVVT